MKQFTKNQRFTFNILFIIKQLLIRTNRTYLLVLGVLFVPFCTFSQSNCSTAAQLNYTSNYTDFHTYQFTDSLYWLTFTTNTSGKAYFSIVSEPDTSGATLEYLSLYDGGCNNLNIVSQKTFLTNDSLSVSFLNLAINHSYLIKIRRTVINGCLTCDDKIKIRMMDFSTSLKDTTFYFGQCLPCFSGGLVLDGDFNDVGHAYFGTNYMWWNQILNTNGQVFKVSDIGTWEQVANQYYHALSFPPGSITDKYLVCDLPNNGTEPNIWNQTLYWLDINKKYTISFYVTNLDWINNGQEMNPPRVQFLVGNNVISPTNITTIPPTSGPYLSVDIPKDETWHRLCYTWTPTASVQDIHIKQLCYDDPFAGHDLGIDYIMIMQELDPPTVNMQNDIICPDESINLGTLVQVTGGHPPYMYQWNNLSTANPYPDNTVSPSVTTTYDLTVTDSYGCTTTGQVTISVVDHVPNFEIDGFNNNCTQLTTYVSTYNNQGYYYQWTILPSLAGTISGNSAGNGVSSISVNWNFHYNSGPIVAFIRLCITNGCDEKCYDLPIYYCCHEEYSTVQFTNESISGTLTYSDDIIEINGTLDVYGSLTFGNNCIVGMGALARIVVHSGASLYVKGDVDFGGLCHYYMWDGIYAEGPNALVCFMKMNNNYPDLKDAINGIVSQNGGILHISNSTFENNYNSIQIKKYSTYSLNYYGPIDVYINGCSFDCEIPGTSHHKLPYEPYYNQLPNAGVYVDQVEGLIIGNSGFDANSFIHLQRGIYSVNSSVSVENSTFTDMPDNLDIQVTTPYTQAAILAKTTITKNIFHIDPLIKVNGGASRNVKFNNCYVGISAQNIKADINQDEFTDNCMPIHVLDARFPTNIISNLIQKGANNPTYDIIGTGITVINSNISTESEPIKLQINLNEIYGMKNGIHCVNQNNVGLIPYNENWVVENFIHFTDDLESSGVFRPRHGILIENCDGINVMANTVDFNTHSIDETIGVRGMKIARSQGAWVSHNIFTKMDAGIYTAGELQNTIFPCNEFHDCYNGFYFGPYTAMTDQKVKLQYTPNIDYCTDNAWYGNYPQGQNNQNHYRMTQNQPPSNISNQYIWYYNSHAGAAYQLDADHILGYQIHPCVSYIDPITLNSDNICSSIESEKETNITIDTTQRHYLFEDILDENIVYYLLESQNRFYEKDYLFTFLLKHPESILLGGNDDVAYQEFVDNLFNTDIDYIQKVYAFMKDKQLDSASYYNEMLSNADDWISNRKVVNEIYLRTWAKDSLVKEPSDSIALLDIALQTPYEGGDGVYTARCLLNLFEVETLGIPYRLEYHETQYEKLKIWPNPANTKLYIEIPGSCDEQMQIEIINAAGIKIKILPVKQNDRQILLSVEGLTNGLYFFKLTSGNRLIGISKVSVIH